MLVRPGRVAPGARATSTGRAQLRRGRSSWARRAGLPQHPYRWRVALARMRAAEGDLRRGARPAGRGRTGLRRRLQPGRPSRARHSVHDCSSPKGASPRRWTWARRIREVPPTTSRPTCASTSTCHLGACSCWPRTGEAASGSRGGALRLLSRLRRGPRLERGRSSWCRPWPREPGGRLACRASPARAVTTTKPRTPAVCRPRGRSEGLVSPGHRPRRRRGPISSACSPRGSSGAMGDTPLAACVPQAATPGQGPTSRLVDPLSRTGAARSCACSRRTSAGRSSPATSSCPSTPCAPTPATCTPSSA